MTAAFSITEHESAPYYTDPYKTANSEACVEFGIAEVKEAMQTRQS